MSQFNLSGKIFFFLGGLFHEVVKLETNDWVLLLIPLHSVTAAGEIIEPSDGPRYFSTISLKNFHLFKIAELVINFCLKKFSN